MLPYTVVRLYQWLPFRSKDPSEDVWSHLKGWFGCSNSARDNVRIPKENSSQAEDCDKVLLPHQAAVLTLGMQLSIDFLPQMPLRAGFNSGWTLFMQRLHPVTSFSDTTTTASFWFYLSALMCFCFFQGNELKTDFHL